MARNETSCEHSSTDINSDVLMFAFYELTKAYFRSKYKHTANQLGNEHTLQ